MSLQFTDVILLIYIVSSFTRFADQFTANISIIVEKKHQKRKVNFKIDILLIYFLFTTLWLIEGFFFLREICSSELSWTTVYKFQFFLPLLSMIDFSHPLIRTHVPLRTRDKLFQNQRSLNIQAIFQTTVCVKSDINESAIQAWRDRSWFE